MNKQLLARWQILVQVAAWVCLNSDVMAATVDTARVQTKVTPAPTASHTKDTSHTTTNFRTHSPVVKVKGRMDHSINRYAVGAQTLTGGRGVPLTLDRSLGSRGGLKGAVEHLVLAGKDDKARNADPKSPDAKDDRDNRDNKDSAGANKNTKKARGGKYGNANDNGYGYDGANGDSGGGGTQLGSINSSPNNIPPATADQARAFWNIVRSDFKHWDVVPDGRLTLPEIRRGLSSASVKADKAAALAALLITMKDGSHRTATATPKYWSMEGLQKLVDAAVTSKKSRLINRFAKQQEALQDKQPSKLSLFKPDGKPALEDIRVGAADNNEFVTAAAALARLNPDALSSMITAGKKGAFLVTLPTAPQQQVQLTDGEVAQFASTGRNVLWVDVLEQAHEQLAEQAGDPHGKGLLTADHAKAADVIALLTNHDTDALDLSKSNLSQLQTAIANATSGKRLMLLSCHTAHHAAIVAYDKLRNAAEVFEPTCTVEDPVAGNASGVTDATNTSAPQTRWVPVADLPKQYTKLTIETDRQSPRNYRDIIAKENTADGGSAANQKSEDAALWELAYAGLDSAGLESAKGAAAAALNNGGKTLQVKLTRGSALVAHENRVQLNAGACDVRIAPNAAAYVLKSENATAVYNISDFHAGQVSIAIPNSDEKIVVPVGEEVVIGDNPKASFEDASPDKTIATRNVVAMGVIAGKAVYRAEFSFTSLLDNAAGFEDLVNSDKAGDLKTVKRLIKTAAIMLTLRPAFGSSPEASTPDSKNGGTNAPQIETMNAGTGGNQNPTPSEVTATGPIAKP